MLKFLEVWSELLLHRLDSPRSLHLSACASDFWTCLQTPPFTHIAQKGWQSTGLEGFNEKKKKSYAGSGNHSPL